MPLNSLNYFIFLPVVYLVFYFLGERFRWVTLLVASLLFYSALDVPYLLAVLMLVATTTYGFAIWLDQAKSEKKKRVLLCSGIAINILVLIGMKYLPFLFDNLRAFSSLISFDIQIQPAKVLVSIGISFYVFQAISYLFDVYLEIEKPERHFGYFTLYLSFFPKLLQGPIERSGELLPQLKTKYEFNYDNMRFGLLLFTWGLLKKVVADQLGSYVDAAYKDVYAFTGIPLILATYAYAIQIYMDFSGYTDMALGSARLFNINLTQNFNSPYLATSVADFWRRWHISFSRWILDYIFKPMQFGWRHWGQTGTAIALVITFLFSGIWHGATWSFVIWGGLHGFYQAFSVFYRPYQKRIYKCLGIEQSILLRCWQTFITFNLVSFAWIFFRSKTLNDAWVVLKGIFCHNYFSDRFLINNSFAFIFMISIITMTINNRIHNILYHNIVYRWLLYYILVILILIYRKDNTIFMYLNF